jgi:hypothetical protein
MSIFKRLYHFLKDKVSRFKSKRRNKKVISKIRKATLTVRPETEKRLTEILLKDDSEVQPFIDDIIEATTISELAEVANNYESSTTRRRNALELHELEAELNRLNTSFYGLEIKQRKIESIKLATANFIDKQVANLYDILNKHNNKGKIQLSKTTISQFDKSFSDLEKLLNDNSTTRNYQRRELEKKKQEEQYKRQLKTRLGEVEMLIGQNKLAEAKINIASLEKILKQSSFQKEKERLQKIKVKFRDKEISNLQKVQDEILKKQKVDAEKLRLAEIDQKKIIDSEKVFDFVSDTNKDGILDNYRIDYLYHMTEVSNLPNIFKHGLLSHNEAHSKGLNQTDIALQDVNQRRASKKPIYGISLHNFVPMYFNPKNPMLFRRKDLQQNIVIIAIDRRAIYQDKSMFSDGNAASDSTAFYNDLSKLDKLNWSCIRNDFWNDYPDGKRVKCSETLTFPKITIKHIHKIYCNNIKTKNLVDQQSPINKTFQTELNSKFFFNSNFNLEFSF